MPGKIIWKTIIKYVAGVLGLVVAVVAAWFVPGWYSSWQDEALLNQVTLESRENIQFLDTESLDIAGRIRALGESVSFDWEFGYYIEGYDLSEKDMISNMKSRLQAWTEAGLMPEAGYEEMLAAVLGDNYYDNFLNEKYTCFGDKIYVYLDEGVLSAYLFRFWNAEQELALTVVLDSEKELLYYASVSGYGETVMHYVAECLGYTGSDAVERFLEGKASDGVTREYEFAQVCGAGSAAYSGTGKALDCDVTLKFENFDGYAGRRCIETEVGPGVATMYGTERWMDLVTSVMESMGYQEYHSAWSAWLDNTAVNEEAEDYYLDKDGKLVEETKIKNEKK